MKKIFAALALLCALSAHATNYYLSSCGTGHDASCVAGDDTTGAGTFAAPWQNRSKLPALVAGDIVHYAQGGAWDFTGSIGATYGTRASPITYTNYTPSWCVSACLTQKPILNFPVDTTGMLLTAQNGSALSLHQEGLVVSHIEFKAGAGSTTHGTMGIQIYNDKDWLVFDDLTISGFGIGLTIQGVGNGVGVGSDGINQYITLKNSYIHDNRGQGYLGYGRDILIENNVFADNGKDACGVFCHDIYIGGNSGVSDNPLIHSERTTVRGNTVSGSSVNAGICGGVQINVHGNHDGLVIENNYVDGGSGSNGACYGINVVAADGAFPTNTPEVLQNVVIRGNTVVNAGGQGIGLSSCINCVVENNVIYFDNTSSHVGIAAPANSLTAGDAIEQATTFRNNSIYFVQANSGSKGILLDTYGTNHKVVSNLIYFGSASATGHVCFQPGALSMFDAFDYNLCYDASAFYKWSAASPTVPAAGFDVHGLNTDPVFVATPTSGNGYSMAIQTTSPAKNAGHPSLSSGHAFAGRRLSTGADAARDIGAYEFGSGNPVPLSPIFTGQ